MKRLYKEQDELQVIYQHVKEQIAPSNQNRQLDAGEQAALQKEPLQVNRNLDDCQLIETLLDKLEKAKIAFQDLLIARKENLSNYNFACKASKSKNE